MFTLCRQPQSSNFHLRVVLTLIVLASLIATPIVPVNPVGASAGNPPLNSTQESVPETPEEFGKLPLQFELNQGQTDPKVQFLTRAGGATVFLKSDETTFLLSEAKSQDRNDETTKEVRTRKHAIRMKINNSNATARLEGVDRLPGDANYLIGNDPSKWHTHIPTFSRLKLQDAYPGVDLVYYGTRGQLEYDFVVRPGVDAGQV